jgi:hypothetical protein
MSNALILWAVFVGVLALGTTIYAAGVYYASKELSKLTSDILRAWTND